ncbi:MAG: hypothetical protein M1825_003492 [Sarcosagium campestre]|nr:MAG: hypothetical protein M1825_003492 [Sarcosagium campestre]
MSTLELEKSKGSRERVVVLGSGWGGFNLARNLDPKKYQALIISPRSYFVFTPLLASTSVGTLEFRTAVEPIRQRSSSVDYIEGKANNVDFARKTVSVRPARSALVKTQKTPRDAAGDGILVARTDRQRKTFDVSYDKLVIAVGTLSQTFDIKGVKENAFFLKDVADARMIRQRILDCFEIAALPSTPEEMKRQLLNFAVVGGGPTGIEFSAELHDLINDDIAILYPSHKEYVQISVYDVAPTVLSMFDEKLAEYATKTFKREGIKIRTEHHVKELRRGAPHRPRSNDDNPLSEDVFTLKTEEEGEVGVGMCVWSTGTMMNPFVKKLLSKEWAQPLPSLKGDKSNEATCSIDGREHGGGIVTNDRLQVKMSVSQGSQIKANQDTMKDVFALGDAANIENAILPATAQVANQKALWLARRLNKGDLNSKSFTFKNLGIMAYLGNWRAIMQGGNHTEIKGSVFLHLSYSDHTLTAIQESSMDTVARRVLDDGGILAQ